MSAFKSRFALNHMCAPSRSVMELFDLASAVGVAGVEIRNDLAGNAILDGTPAVQIKRAAEERGQRILSINALQRFNEWTPEREREARELAAYARDCGAQALVLVPVNDGTGRANGERQANLRIALKALRPILEDAGIRGLVEPLGFEVCSLRLKSEALEAIRALQAERVFSLVHDTFHHFLAGEEALFPLDTGLVHISGVGDPSVAVPDMRDGHRILVDEHDRLGNAAQIRALVAGGYDGFFSFEPFSELVHRETELETALAASISVIERDAVIPAWV
ncbi:TIM barrel protein [Nitratireductor luteus]|uniref:TIM barrel protein n=1 Tax=Nitratireductor luteus TaxID=2976980 RepID=UPI00223F9133|nr:TIM barrel protein [Nitratireductor luteus]